MRLLLLPTLLTLLLTPTQDRPRRAREAETPASRQEIDRRIAAQFAPIIHQGLGDSPRADYLTNFDFDGDWKGDNNWQNLDNREYRLRAYVYHSVVETPTHYFIHYALFHPRDYKGGLVKSRLIDTLIAEGLRRAGKDPTGGLADDVALSHENDLEGVLVVAEKRGKDPSRAVVQFVETLAHNRFLKYRPAPSTAAGEAIELSGLHPLIFVEPKGHGPTRYTGDRQQLRDTVNGVLTYTFTGRAEDPETAAGKAVGYDLIPILDTFWSRARQGENETYGEAFDYQSRVLSKILGDNSIAKVELPLGSLGAAFRGTVGFKNKARPPWGWFDDTEKDRPRGEWFFDPAAVIARHYGLGPEFATAYVYHPYFNI